MSRILLLLAVLLACPLAIIAQDKTDPVDRVLAVQKVMAVAKDYLMANMPAEAVAVLESQLSNADGNPGFLPLLRRAYTAELQRLEANPQADAARAADVRRRLKLLGGPAVDEPTDAAIREARELLAQGKYAEAATKFAAIKGTLPQDDLAAWAYCRVRMAADLVNGPTCDPATAATAEQDVTEAMRLAPNNADVQKAGQAVLVVARQRKNGPGGQPVAGPSTRTEPTEVDGWQTVESASFRVRVQGSRELAEAISRTAEEKRGEIFKRWSGPPAGAWQPRCDIVVHATGESYARATKRPAGETGSATIRLTDGRATERRIELRADDATLLTNALPRELTHVVFADLFPGDSPPKWAVEGIAVLAGSPDEVSRYIRTLPRCLRDNELLPTTALLELKDFPKPERITGFYCQSVSLVDYLVKLRGEQNFTIFLRDCQRYGTASALKRNYSIDGPTALEAAWKRAAFERGP